MNDNEFFDYFEKTKEEFHWFFRDYGYGSEFSRLEALAKSKCKDDMLDIMNHIWFMLPDYRFNIMANPRGWKEFINLLEAE